MAMQQASGISFGRWLTAGLIILIGVAALEQWDTRIAYAAATMILLAVFFRYPVAVNEIRKLLVSNLIPGGGNVE